MRILGIETSCDETGASVVEDKKILSNVVSTSLALHAKTGGIIPEIAARQQISYILPVIEKALKESRSDNIDAIAVTVGPGLIGSLLVGVETAKTLSVIWKKPIIPVNHLIGHIYANWLVGKGTNKDSFTENTIRFPAIALIVSGGHTDLVLIKNHTRIKWLGGTRDDAAGEALDKIGRMLNLPYPSGPLIEKHAKSGNPKTFDFPRPIITSKDFDFSFSGLKTAAARTISTVGQPNNQMISNLCASVQQAIIDVLVKKTVNAAQKFGVKSVLLSGGVAANDKLRTELHSSILNLKSSIGFFAPAKNLCTDNAAMIASCAFYDKRHILWEKIQASPNLYFD